MVDKQLHKLLLLALNRGKIINDSVVISSRYIGKEVLLIEDIVDLSKWWYDEIKDEKIKTKEGIVDQFCGCIDEWDYKRSPININNLYDKYLKKVLVYGKDNLDKYFFRFYSPVKLEIKEGFQRRQYGRSWIDYEKQLLASSTSIIHDEIGIWVCPPEQLADLISSKNARMHYGNSIMVLKMVDGEEYINNYIEFIGQRYEVIHHQKLTSIEDYINFKDYLISIGSNRVYDSAIENIEYICFKAECHKEEIDIDNIDISKLIGAFY